MRQKATENIEMNKPTPIRCKDVMPREWPVCLRRTGTITFFVDGDKNEDIDDAEDGDRTCWNYEVGGEFSVHDVCLADEEGWELSKGYGECNCGCMPILGGFL
ncbi:hypothetical protein D5086_011556 [Populus alba]|uniref:Uncharacterized protein n=2 Tax=Populus alba TaxID=43335 RepID=A0ACC4CD38_POPAL|nr:hypothetical protein D5086_0000153160 [Populus alba]